MLRQKATQYDTSRHNMTLSDTFGMRHNKSEIIIKRHNCLTAVILVWPSPSGSLRLNSQLQRAHSVCRCHYYFVCKRCYQRSGSSSPVLLLTGSAREPKVPQCQRVLHPAKPTQPWQTRAEPQEKKKKKKKKQTVGACLLRVELCAYSPLRCFLHALSHCKQTSFHCKQKGSQT